MAFDFPTAPAVNDEYTIGGILYQWDGLVWAIKGGGDPQDYVLKSGDVMTGPLTLPEIVGPTEMNGTFNQMTGDMEVKTGIIVARANHIYTQGGGRFIFNNTDNNVWQNALSFNGGIHFQYHQGGNNDGRLRLFTSNGGYSDQPIFETTIVNGMPGVNFTGRVLVGSGAGYGLAIGDNWHGWEWNSTYNGEQLKSYQGKFGFHSNPGSLPGTKIYEIDSSGSTGNLASATGFVDRTLLANPELEAFAEGEDTADLTLPRRGINLGALLLHALDRIKALESEVATLKGAR